MVALFCFNYFFHFLILITQSFVTYLSCLSPSSSSSPPSPREGEDRDSPVPSMHAKTVSDVTSIAPSSPTRSPRRPAYYVQSPSRDSHDGEKTATSFHSTPALSPTASPPHSHFSIGHHSRESSSTRFSGSRKISPNDALRKGEKQWKDCAIIEEEGFLDEHRRKAIPRKCYVLAFVIGFFVLFAFFALILYGASKPQKPKIAVKSITFEQLTVQAGSDGTGVATDMVSVNSTVKLTYRNTGTFFGVHVTSSPVDLTYSQLKIGSGAIKKFYQSRKSQRTVSIQVTGDKIPLYGSGSGLTSNGNTATLVPLKLSFTVKSRAYVLGKLVKPKFHRSIDCTIAYDPEKLNAAISLAKSCKYS